MKQNKDYTIWYSPKEQSTIRKVTIVDPPIVNAVFSYIIALSDLSDKKITGNISDDEDVFRLVVQARNMSNYFVPDLNLIGSF